MKRSSPLVRHPMRFSGDAVFFVKQSASCSAIGIQMHYFTELYVLSYSFHLFIYLFHRVVCAVLFLPPLHLLISPSCMCCLIPSTSSFTYFTELYVLSYSFHLFIYLFHRVVCAVLFLPPLHLLISPSCMCCLIPSTSRLSFKSVA